MTRRLSLCFALALAIGCASKVKPPTAVVSVVGDTTSVVTGTLVQVDGSQSTDPQNLTLTFRWFLRSVPAGSVAKLNATDVMSPSFLADVTGQYEIALVVSDGIYSSGAASVIITAEPCGGHAPQVSRISFVQGTTVESTEFEVETTDAGAPDAGPADGGDPLDGGTDAGPVDGGTDAGPVDGGRDAGPTALFREIDVIKLVATIVDPDTDPAACSPAAPAVFSYHWSLQGPAGSQATLSDPTSATPTFAPDLPGNYVAAVQATDLSGRTGPLVSTIVRVAECGDHPPTVTLATTSVQATVNGRLTGSGAATRNTPITLVATGTDIDNGVGPVTRLNCNPTGAFNQAVTVSWAFVSVPFGSRAALNVTSAPAVSSEPVNSTAVFFADSPGNYVLRLSGADSTGRQADPTIISINVDGCSGNHAAVVASLRAVDSNGTNLSNGTQNQTVPGQPVGLQMTLTDVDNGGCTHLQTFTYQWTLTAMPPGSQATLNNPNIASPGFTPDVPGTYTARVVVTDSTGLSSLPATVTVVALNPASSCGGRNPTITSVVGSQSTNVAWRQVIQLEADNLLLAQNPICTTGCSRLFTVDNPDVACVSGLALSFNWSFDSLPAGSQAAFFNPSIQNPSFVPDVPNADYIVRLRVTDSRGLTATATARLRTPSQGANPPAVQFNSAVTTLAFAAANGTTPATVSGAHVGEGTSLTLGRCANGNTQAQVTDADNTTSICTGTPGPQTFSYNWTVVSAPAGSSASILNPATASPSIVPDVEGAYRLRVVVTDSTGLSSAPTDLIVNVGCGASVVPVLSGISATPGGTAAVGVAQQLSVSVTNVDSSGIYTSNGTRVCSVQERFTYAWRFVSLPAGSTATLNDPAARQPSFVPDVASGTWTLAVTVTDLEGRSATATTSVSTNTCGTQNPTINNVVAAADFNSYSGAIAGTDPTVTWDGNGNVSSGSPVFQLGSPISLNASARDNDNTCGAAAQTLRYTWALQSLPAGSAAVLNSSGATASIIPDAPSALASSTALTSDYKVALTVTDSTGRATTTIYSFAVSNCGSFAPDVTSVSTSHSSATGQPTIGFGTSFSPNVTDPNVSSCIPSQFRVPATYQYTWTLLRVPSGSAAFLQPDTGTVPSLVPDLAGRYDVSVVATDLTGRSSLPQTGTINVNSSCGGASPTAQIGTADCSSGSNATICAAPSNTPSSGNSAYSACSGGSGSNCLSTSAAIHVPLNTTFLLGSLTAPANFSCVSQDTWATMDYSWELVTVPNGANPTLSQTATAGTYFRTTTAGTYVVALTVRNVLGLSSTASVTLIAP